MLVLPQLPPTLRRAFRDGYLVASIVVVVAILAGVANGQGDARVYWLTGHRDMYAVSAYAADSGGYFYSPAFAELIRPLTLLPFPVFAAVWTAMLLAVLYALVGAWAPVSLLFLPIAVEIFGGNINLLLAAMCVVGLRWPAVWAFGLLTKVTPGIGLVWFIARREWSKLAVALGVTAGVVVVSFAIDQGAWSRWLSLLQAANGSDPALPVPPLWIRAPIALALVWWGARRNLPWVLPVAVVLTFAVVWFPSLAVLVAIVRPPERSVSSPDSPTALSLPLLRRWTARARA